VTGPISTEGRHPSTRQIAQWFAYSHLPAGKPRHLSAMCAALAGQMVRELPDGPELTAGLRKLLEAKDCFVRAAIEGGE
jgi:hypothetical protein